MPFEEHDVQEMYVIPYSHYNEGIITRPIDVITVLLIFHFLYSLWIHPMGEGILFVKCMDHPLRTCSNGPYARGM